MFNLKKMKRVITFFPCVFFCHSFLVPALTRVIIGSRFVTHFSFCHSFLVPATNPSCRLVSQDGGMVLSCEKKEFV